MSSAVSQHAVHASLRKHLLNALRLRGLSASAKSLRPLLEFALSSSSAGSSSSKASSSLLSSARLELDALCDVLMNNSTGGGVAPSSDGSAFTPSVGLGAHSSLGASSIVSEAQAEAAIQTRLAHIRRKQHNANARAAAAAAAAEVEGEDAPMGDDDADAEKANAENELEKDDDDLDNDEFQDDDDDELVPEATFEIVDALEVPRVLDFTGGAGSTAKGRVGVHAALHGGVAARGNLAVDRLRLVESRLLRLSIFRQSPFAPSEQTQRQQQASGGRRLAAGSTHLTPLDALSGSTSGGTKTVFGTLVSDEEGRWSLEDASGAPPLPLWLNDAKFAPGLLPEGSCVVAEGRLDRSGRVAAAAATAGVSADGRSGAFVVTAIGQPPPEDRASACGAAQGRPVFDGLRQSHAGYPGDDVKWDRAHANVSVAVLSDVFLDLPEKLPNGTWAKLETLFNAYDSMGSDAPSLIVMMGDFLSPAARRRHAASGLLNVLREGFAKLGKLLARQKNLVRNTTLLIVPGPCDPVPSRLVLPRSPFIASVQAACKRQLAAVVQSSDDPPVVFTTSPARVRFGDRELVFHRHNVCEQMRSCNLVKVPSERPPTNEEASTAPSALLRHTAATLLQQSHLSPVPLSVQPVYWTHDHSLYLWPSPHLLVLGDRTMEGGRQGWAEIGTGEDSSRLPKVASPGCFSRSDTSTSKVGGGEFLLYRPYNGTVELCEV